MSKMTRESALEYFKELEEKWLNPTAEYIAHISTKEEIVEHGKYFSEALSILAPEPRTEPSIDDFVREVERRAENNMMKTGKLEGAHYAAMKQYQAELSALPMPKGTDGTATFEKGEG